MIKIKCPFCGFEKEIDEKNIPAGNVVAKCPACEKTFKYNKDDFSFSDTSFVINQSNEQYVYAGFWVRFLALIIDILLLLIVFSLFYITFIRNFELENIIYRLEQGDFSVLFGLSFLLIFLIFISVGYYVIGWSKWGKTIGMKIIGIEVIDAEGRNNISFERAFLRWLMGYFLPVIIPYIALLLYLALAIMIGVDNKKQGWHDRVAKTFVVYEK